MRGRRRRSTQGKSGFCVGVRFCFIGPCESSAEQLPAQDRARIAENADHAAFRPVVYVVH